SQGHVYWLSPAGVLTEEMIDVACAELLRHLIETTQEAIAPGCTGEPVDHTYRHYDISDADPWTQESPYDQVADLMRESIQFEPTLSIDRPGDRSVPRQTQKWNVLNESTSRVAADCNNVVISEPGCFSLTITNANEDDRCSPFPRSVHASDHSGDRSFAKCDGTTTDSVPSLNSLLKESGVFTTAPDKVSQKPAFVASTPVSVAGKSDLFDAAKHGFVPSLRGPFDAAKTGFAPGMNDLLNSADCGSLPGISGVLKVSNVSSAAPNEVLQKVDFDLSTADFEESSTKRKRGVATKRSTKKTASRKAGKKSK
ncbi:MAG: hypothetical protein K2X93_28680, partial [Candidatus Obscuribacterales bacterium]|nr:hypothetical protein [Candidatus Obscuribacterales bacterium]